MVGRSVGWSGGLFSFSFPFLFLYTVNFKKSRVSKKDGIVVWAMLGRSVGLVAWERRSERAAAQMVRRTSDGVQHRPLMLSACIYIIHQININGNEFGSELFS